MITLEEMLKKRVEINQKVKAWGYENPRLFKGVVIKNEDAIILTDESHVLNFLVDKSVDEVASSHMQMLMLDLERTLPGCRVEVSFDNDFNEESTYKIQEAVPLADKTALTAYFGLEWQFDELKLTEKELVTRQHAYENLDFIKNQLSLQKREKRAREEDIKTDIPAAEIAEIEDIERKVDSLSAPAREELLARMQKYKEPKLTATPPASKPITGIS